MIRRVIIGLMKLPIHIYRAAISPLIASNCRFQPTCSAYALEALEQHGAIKGVSLTFKRVIRCRPGGSSGFDPVPPVDEPQNS